MILTKASLSFISPVINVSQSEVAYHTSSLDDGIHYYRVRARDEAGNWGYGFDFTVDPLPFMEMSGFPYPLDTESYPYDQEHIQYLQEYNTREITK